MAEQVTEQTQTYDTPDGVVVEEQKMVVVPLAWELVFKRFVETLGMVQITTQT